MHSEAEYRFARGLVASALAVALVACAGPPAGVAAGGEAMPPPVPIELVRAVPETSAPAIRISGTLAPDDEHKLGFKVGGVIERLTVDEGDFVRRGQVLASIALSEIDAQVAQAEQSFEKARRDAERADKLADAKVVTLEQRQDAATGLELAKRQLEIARFNRTYAVITAPASGRILKRLASAGEVVAPGVPVLVLGATEGGWVVRATLTDRQRVRVKLGDGAALRFDALGELEFGGVVTELASAASPMTGTYTVELSIAAPEPRLVSGLFARGELRPSATETVTWLPPSALLEADGARGVVYVLTPERTALRRVELRLGAIQGERVAVLSGLEPGQEVVVAGAAYLVEGAELSIRDHTQVARAP